MQQSCTYGSVRGAPGQLASLPRHSVAFSRSAFERARSASRRDMWGIAEATLCLASVAQVSIGRVCARHKEPTEIKPRLHSEVRQ